MTDDGSFKPQRLRAFQAHLRTHPVQRGVFFWLACWLLFGFFELVNGKALSIRRLAIELVAWAFAAILFHFLVEWTEARQRDEQDFR